LDEIVKVLGETRVPYMVGFNRRFSPLAIEVKEIVKDRVNPMVINYRANAGNFPPEHWSQSEEGGGRILGEACHFFDLFNYFTDVEQAAFSPGNLVPGIAPSPDKMLQGRIFAYHDAHRYRLGPNYEQLPVNAPKAAVNTYQRDGFMRLQNFGGEPNYWPNSFGGPEPDPRAVEPGFEVTGIAARHAYTHPNDDFVQPTALYEKVMTDIDRDHLIGNIVGHLGGAKKEIQLRQTGLFYKVHPEYGTRVAEGLGLDVEEVKRLSQK